MDLQEIREIIEDSVSMPSLVEDLGIPFQGGGGTPMKILCTHHNDRSYGSCIVFEKNIFCYSCHTSLNAIDLVMETRSCNFMDAVKYISDLYGLQLDFTPDEERVEPLVIPKSVFEAATLNDTAAFKKLYDENPQAAIQLLSFYTSDALQRYAQVGEMELPPKAAETLQRNIDILQKARKNFSRWKKEAAERPLRVK